MSDAAINELARPWMGHNLPPLAERLADELGPFRASADELVAIASTARIADDSDAEKVAILIAKLRDQEKALDKVRDERKRPFLDAGRLVDAAYGAVMRPLALVRAGADGRGGLGALLTEWNRKREVEAQRERERLAAEQRAKEAEAEHARQEAEAAKAAGGGGIAAELDAIRKEEEAAKLQRQAETLRPEPIRTPLGNVTGRREIAFEITDLRKLLGWMLKQPLKGGVEQACRTMLGNYLRQLGVDAVARGVDIPGVEARVESRAQVR